ncbi:MAG TPA: cellulase family glycosylhydrolase [Candidatus Saccharimonadales bacterium]|nr:cellulase family glycosylhydrolase [Candidatus Saccharimonadales bacterium]
MRIVRTIYIIIFGFIPFLFINPSPTFANGITGLHVVGGLIQNDSGQTITLHGVNRAGTEYMCVQSGNIFDGPSDAASMQAIAAWHTNVIRVPLNEDCWLGINGANPGGAAYQTAIINYVNTINSQGLAVVLDLHWSAPGSTKAISQQVMPDQDHSPAFWTSVATTFKNNTSVIFDLYNEPHDVSWTCWKDGGNSCGSFPIAGMQTLVNAIRATGATNLIMAGGLAWSNDLSQWLTNKPSDSANNLVAAWHVYNFNQCNSATCWDSVQAPISAQYPIIIGEMGENDCAHGFIDTLMNWMDSHHQNYIGWSWNTASCGGFPALITSYDGTPSNFGIGLRDHLAALSATLTTAPSGSITPTETAVSGVKFALALCPHGLGNCGDSVTPNNGGNTNPKHTQRNMTLTILNAASQPVATAAGVITYQQTTKNFQGTVPVSSLPTGQYRVRVTLPGFLSQQYSGIITVSAGNQTITPASLSLVSGNINNDGQLDISDYNVLISCYGTKQNTPSCMVPPTTAAAGADVSDDGLVNGIDYNLFLRDLSVQKGG